MQKARIKRQNVLIFLIVLVIGLKVLAGSALAKETLEFGVKEEASKIAKVEYILPYPGILADNPFYFLKMIRDRVWGFLIHDPLKNSRWCLLMADKRIWASQMLMEKGKFDLAVSTATKAEKYLEKAVDKVYQAKKMGNEDRALLEKIGRASLKHKEILNEVLEKAPQKLKPVIQKTLEYSEHANQKTLELLKEK